MNIEVVEQYTALARMREEWEELHSDSATDSVFASWTWCDAWLRHFGTQEKLWLVTARDDANRLIGIAPLALRTVHVRPLPQRYLQFIGSSAPLEHFDFILRRGRESEALPAMLAAVQRAKFDVLELANIVPHSPSLPILRDSGVPFTVIEDHVAPVLALPADMDGVLARQDKKKSERARYYMRRIERDYPGRWACEVVKSDCVNPAFDELIQVHQSQWVGRGHAGAFGDAALTAFYRDVAQRLCDRGWLRMYRLVVDGQLVSANLAIVYRDRFLHFVNGTDYSVPVQSPGVVLHYNMIERSIAEGVREYDFMWGEESYKYDWGAERRVDLTLTWARSPRARLLKQARRVWRAVRRRVRPDS
ncbi:MAG TPA: GNAT family N-acetyltransferase [Thermoanaerobaculia bacterium]|nr:GNAT family N-acetyltransferase [Thermoanaerobaculia bacterium]